MKIMTSFMILAVAGGTAVAQDQQIGARTKAMGGSYTAFEDDPVSVWLNPAGIAAQPDQVSLAYQTYVAYPIANDRGPGDTTITSGKTETILVAPVIIPSFLGAVFQLGDEETSMAIGACFARPYHLNYALDEVTDPMQPTFTPESNVEQSLSRIRVAFAYDIRIREQNEAGWFSHLSLGVGMDLGFMQWRFTTSGQDTTDTTTSLGFGMGALLGVFDNMKSVRVNLGLAYQSGVQYDFDIAPDILPAFDMPQQVNVGLTFYLLEGMPLRITLDSQWIDWSRTAERPIFAGHPSFEDAVNFSIGGEYRVQVSEKVFLYPRLGLRRFDAPWDDADNLPMTGPFKLVLDTKGEVFTIFTFGVGISWSTEGGKVRSIDLAGDVGGDSFNAAFGYTHEF
jgi:long-subunit fatty acid transport protein